MQRLTYDIKYSNTCRGSLKNRILRSSLLSKLLKPCIRFQECKGLSRSSNTIYIQEGLAGLRPSQLYYIVIDNSIIQPPLLLIQLLQRRASIYQLFNRIFGLDLLLDLRVYLILTNIGELIIVSVYLLATKALQEVYTSKVLLGSLASKALEISQQVVTLLVLIFTITT